MFAIYRLFIKKDNQKVPHVFGVFADEMQAVLNADIEFKGNNVRIIQNYDYSEPSLRL